MDKIKKTVEIHSNVSQHKFIQEQSVAYIYFNLVRLQYAILKLTHRMSLALK